jgi:hypothetical protein
MFVNDVGMFGWYRCCNIRVSILGLALGALI